VSLRVLRHRQINPAVRIKIGQRRSSLFAIENHS
jgi:hypothetical protein